MICVLCGQKLRWWERSVSSVTNANRYHLGVLGRGWDPPSKEKRQERNFLSLADSPIACVPLPVQSEG